MRPDGTIKTANRFHKIVQEPGQKKLTKAEAKLKRDEFLQKLNAAPTRAQVPTAPVAPAAPSFPDPGDILFGKLADLWQRDYVEKVAAGKHVLAAPTRESYAYALDNILPRWKDVRLKEIRAKAVLDWLEAECKSWWGMNWLKNTMGSIIKKGIEWELIPETYANPISRVRMPKQWLVRERRILTPEQTENVLALLEEPIRLICETCVDTGTRISEVTGLMIKHVDLSRGTIRIDQRNWRGDIDDPKTKGSRRELALGTLTERYRAWIEALKYQGLNAWVFPQPRYHTEPRWDSGVRKALKAAAGSLGLDFQGFGPHSLRRYNITMRQEVGATAIEASKIAGHSSVDMTGEYTIVQMKRQTELTRRMQSLRTKSKKAKVVEIKKSGAA